MKSKYLLVYWIDDQSSVDIPFDHLPDDDEIREAIEQSEYKLWGFDKTDPKERLVADYQICIKDGIMRIGNHEGATT